MACLGPVVQKRQDRLRGLGSASAGATGLIGKSLTHESSSQGVKDADRSSAIGRRDRTATTLPFTGSRFDRAPSTAVHPKTASLDAARHGNCATWIPGSYDPETNLVEIVIE